MDRGIYSLYQHSYQLHGLVCVTGPAMCQSVIDIILPYTDDLVRVGTDDLITLTIIGITRLIHSVASNNNEPEH